MIGEETLQRVVDRALVDHRRRSKWMVTTLVATLLVAAAGGIWFLVVSSESDQPDSTEKDAATVPTEGDDESGEDLPHPADFLVVFDAGSVASLRSEQVGDRQILETAGRADEVWLSRAELDALENAGASGSSRGANAPESSHPR